MRLLDVVGARATHRTGTGGQIDGAARKSGGRSSTADVGRLDVSMTTSWCSATFA